jgi:hypothetical protein
MVDLLGFKEDGFPSPFVHKVSTQERPGSGKRTHERLFVEEMKEIFSKQVATNIALQVGGT